MMKISINLSIAFVLATGLLISCEETVQLDVKQVPPKIVIEGQVTNKAGYQYVKVTRTSPFYVPGKTPRVTDGVVSITDDLGASYVFVHNPGNHPDSAGFYLPEENFVGEIGREYTLHVTADDELYEAVDQMYRVTSIDSIRFQVNDDEQADPREAGKFYELLMYAKEPQDEKNYYLFKYFRNDSIIVYYPNDIYYSNDDLIGENIDGITSPVYYGLNDRARLEVHSLSRRAYVFYNDLYSVLNNDGGGMFGPIPASPRNNITGGAMGFFQVSAVSEAGMLVE